MTKKVLLIVFVAIFAAIFTGCEKNIVEPEQVITTEKGNETPSLRSGSIMANYYPNDAASYAITYAYNYNSSYFNWGDVPNSSDCANFISQCLVAGDLPTDPTTSVNTKWWYNHTGDSDPDNDIGSYAWKKVGYLWEYLLNSDYSISTYAIENVSSFYTHLPNLSKGDLVFYHPDGNPVNDFHKRNNGAAHVTIITTKTSNGAYVTGHTANQKNFSLKSYITNYMDNENRDYVVVLHFN